MADVDVPSIEGKVDTWMQSAVRDWFLILLGFIHLLWSLIAIFIIVRGRKLRFNRQWPARVLLTILGFLWPATFVLTTALVQNSLIMLTSGNHTHEASCNLFVVLVHGFWGPMFCIVLTLLVKYHWHSCTKNVPCLEVGTILSTALGCLVCFRSHTDVDRPERRWMQDTISPMTLMLCTIALQLPSAIYHLIWHNVYQLEYFEPMHWGSAGPCHVQFAHLIGTSCYVLAAVILINIFLRRLSRIAINKLLHRRLCYTHIAATVLLPGQLMFCYVTVIWRDLGDMTRNIIFIAYYIDVSLLCVVMVWFLAVRPVLQDYAPRSLSWTPSDLWPEYSRILAKDREAPDELGKKHQDDERGTFADVHGHAAGWKPARSAAHVYAKKLQKGESREGAGSRMHSEGSSKTDWSQHVSSMSEMSRVDGAQNDSGMSWSKGESVTERNVSPNGGGSFGKSRSKEEENLNVVMNEIAMEEITPASPSEISSGSPNSKILSYPRINDSSTLVIHSSPYSPVHMDHVVLQVEGNCAAVGCARAAVAMSRVAARQLHFEPFDALDEGDVHEGSARQEDGARERGAGGAIDSVDRGWEDMMGQGKGGADSLALQGQGEGAGGGWRGARGMAGMDVRERGAKYVTA